MLDVDVQVAGFAGLEGAMRGLRLAGLQRLQVAHPMAAQAAVEPGARDVRVQELAHHGEKVVERQEQGGECPIFCVTGIWFMLPERSKDDDDIQGITGRAFERLRAA